MEVNITPFLRALDAQSLTPFDLSRSAAEAGQDAGLTSWANAQRAPEPLQADQMDAARAFILSSGGWSDAEVQAMTDGDVQALIAQWIAGDMREPVGFDLSLQSTAEEWAAYEEQSRGGLVAGRLFNTSEGEVYWHMDA